jgi:DNA polymerase-3 subunit epsilon
MVRAGPVMLRWFTAGRNHELSNSPFTKDTPLDAVRYVVLDTELTSINSRSNRLLSVGAIVMDGTRIRIGEQFYRELNPGVPLAEASVLVHKLRPHDVADAEPPQQVLADLQKFIAGSVLVGHFVKMDLKILKKELAGMEHELNNPGVDTARVQEWILRREPYSEDLPHRLENLDLLSLAKVYGLDWKAAHHALSDAFVTAEIWQKMIHVVQAKGVRKLGDLLRIGRV